MEEQLISFKTAKLAKEKGFDIATIHRYDEFGQIVEGMVFSNREIYAPTQSLLQKWLREKHKIHIWTIMTGAEIFTTHLLHDYWTHVHREKGRIKEFDTHEMALEKGLQIALKLI